MSFKTAAWYSAPKGVALIKNIILQSQFELSSLKV
jgi:hypothetical protein